LCGCHPLARIAVVHTKGRNPKWSSRQFGVVIPWRRWRRFTHTVNGRDVEFTFYRLSSPGGDLGVSQWLSSERQTQNPNRVVIPWRGFRCFTRRRRRRPLSSTLWSCNPLAGI